MLKPDLTKMNDKDLVSIGLMFITKSLEFFAEVRDKESQIVLAEMAKGMEISAEHVISKLINDETKVG
jgi:hypothetical protein